MRLDAEDGLWAISVAETPYDARAYSLYIKSEFFAPACLLVYTSFRKGLFKPKRWHMPMHIRHVWRAAT